MAFLEISMLEFLTIFINIFDFVSSSSKGSLKSSSYEEIIYIVSVVSVVSLLLVVVGCLNWKNWKICRRFKFNNLECGHSNEHIAQFPNSFNNDRSVAFDSLPDIEVSIPGSPPDILEKYFFPKIYTEKNLTRIDVEKEVELLMKTLKSKYHVERLDVETRNEIGKGWFGPVMNGSIRDGSRFNKCVVSSLNELAASSQVLNYFKETAAYREIKHANVMRMLFANIDTIPFWTILEFCHLGDLKSYMIVHRVAHESIVNKGLLIKFAVDMATGLNALHDHKYVHRDFATRNCLVSSDLTIKIGDYGIAFDRFRADYFEWGGFYIPLRWLAPETYHYVNETFKLRKRSKMSNIWSFGVSLWELISFGMLPYPELSNEELLKEREDGDLKRFFQVNNLLRNSEKLAKVMTTCLVNVHKRPSLQTLISELSVLKNDLTSDQQSLTLMKDTLSNSGSPCEFLDVDDAFSVEAVGNENFNFDSIALSFEPASDDDFDIGLNARSSSVADLKKGPQSGEGIVKTMSFDEGMNNEGDEKFYESVKSYYDDMLRKHQNMKVVFDSSPVYHGFNGLENVGNESNEVVSTELEKMDDNYYDEINSNEWFNVEGNKSPVVITSNDIHELNNKSLGLSLASNSDSKIVNFDENSLNNKNIFVSTMTSNSGCFDKDVNEDVDEDVDEDVNEDVDEGVDEDVDKRVGKEVDENVDEDVDKHVGKDVDEHVGKHVDEHVGKHVGKNVDEDVDKHVGKDVDEDVDKHVDEDGDKEDKLIASCNLQETNAVDVEDGSNFEMKLIEISKNDDDRDEGFSSEIQSGKTLSNGGDLEVSIEDPCDVEECELTPDKLDVRPNAEAQNLEILLKNPPLGFENNFVISDLKFDKENKIQ